MNEDNKKTTRLGYLSGDDNREFRFDFTEPCVEQLEQFFDSQATWLDTESDTFKDSFNYQGHGIYDHETTQHTELIPVLKLGKVSCKEFLQDGDSLYFYYEKAYKLLELDKLIDCFVDDLDKLETLNICTTRHDEGAIFWDAIQVLYHLYDSHKARAKCLKLAIDRAGQTIIDQRLILACAETLKAKGSNV